MPTFQPLPLCRILLVKHEQNVQPVQSADPEHELLQRCLRGESQAQYVLYNRYVTAMYNTAIRIVSQAAEAEDVLQEGFTKVFQQLHSFRSESTIGAWIKRIVVNTALQHLRAKQKLQFVDTDVLPDTADEPYEEADSWDAPLLHEAIKKLPDGCRVVFTLFAVENMGHKAIAQELGISESTSKTQYMRAKKLLKAQLLTSRKFHPEHSGPGS